MYCLMSARSMNARSMAPVMFEVARISTFGFLQENMKIRMLFVLHYLLNTQMFRVCLS